MKRLWELGSEQQRGQYLSSKGHRMILNGCRVKISLCCTSTPYDQLTTSISKWKSSDNWGPSSRLDKVWTVKITGWPWKVCYYPECDMVTILSHCTSSPSHLHPYLKWKFSTNDGPIASSRLDKILTVNVTGWSWKVTGSTFNHVAILHHHIFLPYQNVKAVRIRSWAAAQTIFDF